MILGFFTAYSMNFFCSQYLYLSMLALLSGVRHYSQMLIWMPQPICFKHCTEVCSEAFASKGAHLSSAKLAWLWPRAAGTDRGCHVAWNHSEHRQAPLMYLYRRKVHVHLPSTWEPDASSEWKQRVKTATGHGDILLRSVSLAKFREHSTQALPLNWASSE